MVSLVAFRQSCKLVHWNSCRFHVTPVVLLLSALFPNQTEKPKPTHLDRITMQHLSEKQTVFVNIIVVKWLLRNKTQTQWKKTQPRASTVLLYKYSVFWGRGERGKSRGKGMQLENNRFFSWRVFLITVAWLEIALRITFTWCTPGSFRLLLLTRYFFSLEMKFILLLSCGM